MQLLSPVDVSLPIVVTAGPVTEPDVTIRVGAEGTPFAFFLRTVERIGMRIDDNGNVFGSATDTHSLAEMAVSEFLLAQLDENLPRQELYRRMQKINNGAATIDWSQWEWMRIDVDGTTFALRVRYMNPGFTAIADLGLHYVTMRGVEVPGDLRFTMRRPLSS